MIKFYVSNIINKINTLPINQSNFPYELFDKNIIKEIELINNYKYKLRTLLGYKIEKEKYIIENIFSKKKNSYIHINLSLLHYFYYIKNNTKIKSQEKINLIIIGKKIKSHLYIIDICNKDIFPNSYKKLLNTDSFYNIQTPVDINERLLFLENELSSANSTAIKFKKLLRTGKYQLSFRGDSYNSYLAVKYATKYAFSYNPKYKNFDKSGGDCTNFVSQCLHAGNIPLTNTWKPYSNSWIRVNDLYNYLINNKIGIDVTSKNDYREGSIIQFFSNQKGYFSHSGIITKSLDYGEYLYTCHSYDKLNFPLSEIFPFMYDKIRVIQPI